MKKLRIILLVHTTLMPPDDLDDQNDPRMEKYQTEYDVLSSLKELGHEVNVIGLYDDLAPIRSAIEEWQPDIVFNLLEEFAGNPAFDYYVVSYLEMMKIPYTGCNPRGLLLARDKALSKKLLSFHHISVPNFIVFPTGKALRKNARRHFPMIVKSLMEEGSVGIAQASYVENDEQLKERVALLHEKTGGDAIAEQFIDGRELYVSILGNTRLTVLPTRELTFSNTDNGIQRMATYKVKWDHNYRDRWGIDYQFARILPNGVEERIIKICKRAYKILDLNGYARFDLRMSQEGKVYLIEANPNPGIAHNDDCALAAEKAGLEYNHLIQRILNLGMRA